MKQMIENWIDIVKRVRIEFLIETNITWRSFNPHKKYFIQRFFVCEF